MKWKKEIPSISNFRAADEKWLGGFYSGSQLNSNSRQSINSAEGSESNGCPALAPMFYKHPTLIVYGNLNGRGDLFW